jgi:hypothetical protein
MTEPFVYLPEITEAGRLRALLEGSRGAQNRSVRLHRSDVSGGVYEELEAFEGGTVSMSNFREHTWELSVRRRDIGRLGLFGEYVRAFVDYEDPEWDETLSFPMGHYRFERPRGTHSQILSTYELTGRSAEVLLLESGAYQGYKANAGTNILTAVASIITARGVPSNRIKFPAVTKTLTSPFQVSPLEAYEESYWLRIANSLLAAGGFYALYTDAEGFFTTKEMESVSTSTPHVTYGNVGDAEDLVTGDVAFEEDDERFENRKVVYAGDPNTSATLYAIAELRSTVPAVPTANTVYLIDPDSPATIDAMGMVIQKEAVTLPTLVSVTTAKSVALTHLKISAGLNEKVQLTTVPDPRRGPREDYGIELANEDGDTLYTGRFNVTGWTFPLDLSAQTHELSRLVKLGG